MNLYTVHRKPKSHKCTGVSDKQKCLQSLFELSRVHVKLSQSAGWNVPDSWSSDRETSVTQSSTGPRDGSDVDIGRTKMTSPRVVLVMSCMALLRQLRRGLVSQRLEYQDDQLVLNSASHWQPVKSLQNRRNVVASPRSCQETSSCIPDRL